MTNELNKKGLETVSGGAGLLGEPKGHNGWTYTGNNPTKNGSGYLCPYCAQAMESRGRQVNSYFDDPSWFDEHVCHQCNKHFALFEDNHTWYER